MRSFGGGWGKSHPPPLGGRAPPPGDVATSPQGKSSSEASTAPATAASLAAGPHLEQVVPAQDLLYRVPTVLLLLPVVGIVAGW